MLNIRYIIICKVIIIIITIIIIIVRNNKCDNTSGQQCPKKGNSKKLKYYSSYVEIQRMWNMKCMIIPAIFGATGIVTEGLKKNLEAKPGKHSIDSLQKTAVLGTSYTIQKTLQSGTVGITAG
jgi:hypothetical protein